MVGIPVVRTVHAGARLVVEAAWGADLTADPATWTWSDISADLLDDPGAAFTVGAYDEASTAPPATCSFKLKNGTGRYTPNQPLSPLWPYIRKGTPIRVRMSLDNGATWALRWQGRADGWTPTWDQSTRAAIVVVSASGITRPLGQGSPVAMSVMRRAATALDTISSVAGYWPGEDSSGSSGVASGLDSGLPMRVRGNPSFAVASYWPGSQPVISLGDSDGLDGPIPQGSAAGAVHFRTLLRVPSGTPDGRYLLRLKMAGGTVDRWYLRYGTGGGISLLGYNSANALIADSGTWTFGVDNKPLLLGISLVQSGANAVYTLATASTSDPTDYWIASDTFISLTIGRCVGVSLSGVPGGLSVGHVGVASADAWLSPDAGAYDILQGHAGEPPSDRIRRVCGEYGIPVATVGGLEATTLMGPQPVAPVMDILRECETTDGGQLCDGLTPGLTYESINQRYDVQPALTLNAAASALIDPAPVDDDQQTCNRAVVTRTGGSSATAEDATGELGTTVIGAYERRVGVNSLDDSRLPHRAAWMVHSGTTPGLRYPRLAINLMGRSGPAIAAAWLARSVWAGGGFFPSPGFRVDVTNLSTVLTQHPPGTVSLMLLGWTETISARTWTLTANCAPYRPYEVWKIGDTRLGRIGASASTLASGASIGATSLSVATAAGHALWTTAAGDFQLDVEISGIQVHVTSITGASSPQTFTVTGVTKALPVNSPVRMWRPGVIRL